MLSGTLTLTISQTFVQALPWGGKLTSESLSFFSPVVLWTRFPSSEYMHEVLYSAFVDYLKVHIALLHCFRMYTLDICSYGCACVCAGREYSTLICYVRYFCSLSPRPGLVSWISSWERVIHRLLWLIAKHNTDICHGGLKRYLLSITCSQRFQFRA